VCRRESSIGRSVGILPELKVVTAIIRDNPGRPVVYFFAEFSLDVETRTLSRDGREVPLFPKAFDLLLLLVESRPRVLAKAELHERLWPGTYVSESSLSGLIGVVREALDDDPRQPRFLRTAHRIGYAFVGATEIRSATPSATDRPTAYWLTLPNRQYALKDGENVIGRDPTVDVPLVFPGVSRRHARIVIADGHATVEDLASKNGTCLNARRVTAETALRDGDQVTIGPIVLTFRAPEVGITIRTETLEERD
jgi:DNA-binding winged helix-turn-helix (wHTH) protein